MGIWSSRLYRRSAVFRVWGSPFRRVAWMGEAIGAALSFDAVFGQLIRDVDIPVSCLIGVDDVCFLSGSLFFVLSWSSWRVSLLALWEPPHGPPGVSTRWWVARTGFVHVLWQSNAKGSLIGVLRRSRGLLVLAACCQPEAPASVRWSDDLLHT